MDIKGQLEADMREAMKARDATRLSAIRMLRAAIQTMEIARTDPADPKHGQPIEEDDRIAAVIREASQRYDTLEFARKAGRTDLIEQEQAALDAMDPYLPLTKAQITAEIDELMVQLGGEFKKVMPAASQRFRGRAPGKMVADLVRERTSG